MSSFTYTGTVVQDQPGRPKRSGSGGGNTVPADSGVIKYQANGSDLTIHYLVSRSS